MIINKSQGQSLSHVTIYLPSPVFAYGQLYVALNRLISFQGVKVFITLSKDQHILPNNQGFCTLNIGYKEIQSILVNT